MTDIQKLLDIMARLRDPQDGCPWDVQQTFASIAPYTVEEAYEVADAIARDDRAALCDELGDLLLQVVFHARMAEEAGDFDFGDVVAAIVDKMVRRHPHVFAAGPEMTADGMPAAWEEAKAAERDPQASVLSGVALALPALMRAGKLGKRAARVGFDWPDAQGVYDKIAEELAELRASDPGDADAREEELGDVLFAMTSLARHLKVDPEAALRRANAKFERRFAGMERELDADALGSGELGLDALEAAWQRQKKHER